MDQYLIFHLDAHLFAFPIEDVKRVVQMVAIRPLSQSSKHLLGVIDFHGTIISVVNFRTLLGLPPKEVEITDFLLFL